MNRPVELEAIWGEPVRAGINAGCDIVRLQCLYNLIRISIVRRDSDEIRR